MIEAFRKISPWKRTGLNQSGDGESHADQEHDGRADRTTRANPFMHVRPAATEALTSITPRWMQ